MIFAIPTTLSVLYFLALLAAAWECWTIVNRKRGDTFSATLRKLAIAQPFIAFMCGMLMRHLYSDDQTTREAFEAGYRNGVYWPLKDSEDAPPKFVSAH